MLRYLKAAFLVRMSIPGLGDVPINALIVAAFAILGFGHPAFWLLGLGIETAIVVSLAGNRRFQHVTDAVATAGSAGNALDKRRALAGQLTPPTQHRLADLDARCARAADLARGQGVEDYIVDSNRDALYKLSWLYLKLLLARQYLLSQKSQVNEASLHQQIDQLIRETNDPKISDSIRLSKAATVQILQKRVENLERREQSLKEIESDLTRIEAQVDLAVENAGMSGQPQAVSTNISLVSQLLEPDLFGTSQSAVADLDQAYERSTG